MRKMAMILAATFLALSTAPAFAQRTMPSENTTQKDECLLASRNCMNQVDDIRDRIYRLNEEIQKGTRVYSPQELKKLEQKLQETRDILWQLERPDS